MHKLLGVILDLKQKENLYTAQKILCELSKLFQKDDIFYITGSVEAIHKNEFDSFLFNYKYSNSLAEELEELKLLTRSVNQFKTTYLILSDNQDFKLTVHNKIKKLKTLGADVIFISQENSFSLLEKTFKEIYGTQ